MSDKKKKFRWVQVPNKEAIGHLRRQGDWDLIMSEGSKEKYLARVTARLKDKTRIRMFADKNGKECFFRREMIK